MRGGSWREAASFLTVMGRGTPPSPRAFAWFPVVGALLGAGLGVLWWAAGHVFPGLVVAAVVVGADLVLTGLLHMDGLVDSADGLLPHLERERRLEVMSAPTAGAFGISVAALLIVARFAAVASLVPTGVARSVLLFAGIWCTSRSIMILGALISPYARAGEGHGLAAAFLPDDGASLRRTATAGIFGLGASAGALGWWRPEGGLAAFGAALFGGVAVLVLARRRIGGFTGDVLGAAGVVAETLALIVAAAKW